MKILALLLLVLFNGAMFEFLDSYTGYELLSAYTWESDAFRVLKCGPEIASKEEIDCEELAALMAKHGFNLQGLRKQSFLALSFPTERPREFKKLAAAYHVIFDDLRFFPIPENRTKGQTDISYEDSWMEKRSYGGERGHEGCDLMGAGEPAGYYPVVSMTDGVMERVGWLEKGGWRLGVRAPSGGYFYYAHLASYAREWKEGDAVYAGELLGYMGDSGYGPEGTTGQFPVHLHLGIYLRTDHYEELSVNPYWVLRFLEKRRQKITVQSKTQRLLQSP
ncbi:MAG: M23 family metallopeptidase [Lachnospiraceae bacterium]|jgi:murein DD-endopeptidase MepM/ murein hydrolase activator NlpD|nr:M23 family metallopeptidase [Lachnospiraceae bacterium]